MSELNEARIWECYEPRGEDRMDWRFAQLTAHMLALMGVERSIGELLPKFHRDDVDVDAAAARLWPTKGAPE